MAGKERHVCLILSGGSICMQPSPDGYIPTKGQLLTKCLIKHPSFNDPVVASLSPIPIVVDETGTSRLGDASFVLPATSALEPRVRYTAFEFHDLIDSSAADAHYWNILAACVVANYDAFDAFVFLHGTDTLAWAASALSFLLHPLNKPVILTGSQVSIFDEPSDAWDNILGALLCAAAAVDTMHCEVGIFFHHTLYRGNRTTKVHASGYAAFASPNMPTPLSRFDETKTNAVLCTALHSTAGRDHVRTNEVWPLKPLTNLRASDAAVLRIYPGLSPSTISALISAPGLRGLVLETFGAGAMPTSPEICAILKSAIEERGILIVNVSQCLNGTVTSHYAPAQALEKLGVVYGQDMTTEAAYTKLLWILAQRDSLHIEDMKRLMTLNIRGELSAGSNVVRLGRCKEGVVATYRRPKYHIIEQ